MNVPIRAKTTPIKLVLKSSYRNLANGNRLNVLGWFLDNATSASYSGLSRGAVKTLKASFNEPYSLRARGLA